MNTFSNFFIDGLDGKFANLRLNISPRLSPFLVKYECQKNDISMKYVL